MLHRLYKSALYYYYVHFVVMTVVSLLYCRRKDVALPVTNDLLGVVTDRAKLCRRPSSSYRHRATPFHAAATHHRHRRLSVSSTDTDEADDDILLSPAS